MFFFVLVLIRLGLRLEPGLVFGCIKSHLFFDCQHAPFFSDTERRVGGNSIRSARDGCNLGQVHLANGFRSGTCQGELFLSSSLKDGSRTSRNVSVESQSN